MSLHIGAKKGDIAETVLVSGDPLRAKYIAENILTDAYCYSDVRNMLGYTGYFNGNKVSVQGTGMGQPSLGIYLHELIHSYHVKNIIRIGTCGALRSDLKLGEIIIAQGSCTDSSANKIIFNGMDYAPLADFDLLSTAVETAKSNNIKVKVGNVFSTDFFYFKNDPERWKIWVEYGALCADMETSLLYTMSAGSDVKALSILTVSDNIITGEASSNEDRAQSFTKMVQIALNSIND
jgi:purine-nucleoside phosphorylase